MKWDVDAFNEKTRNLLEVKGAEVAVFRTAAHTQAAIKFASEQGVEVAGLRVIGTDLQSVMFIESKVSAVKHLLSGAMSGLWIGALLAFGYSVLSAQVNLLILFLIGLAGLTGGLTLNTVGLITGSAKHQFITQKGLVAARYAIMAENHIPQYIQFFAAVPGNLLVPEVGLGQAGAGAQPNSAPLVSAVPQDTVIPEGGVSAAESAADWAAEEPKYGVRLPRGKGDSPS